MFNESTLVLAASEWFPWYNWLLIGAVIAVFVGYKLYQKKTMS